MPCYLLKPMSSSPDPLWPELSLLRAELDRVDNAIHDLLIERANVIGRVAGLRAQGKAALRPGREASIIARLLSRNHGALPASAIPRIWREILASSLAMQTDFAVAVAAPGLAPLAREHFGALTPVRSHSGLAAALDDLRQGRVTVALVPWPGTLDPTLLKGLFVVARLPFWRPRSEGTPSGEALVIAATAPDPSGNDCSVVAIDATMEEVEGFLTPDDPRLAALGPDAVLLGAYAVPLSGDL